MSSIKIVSCTYRTGPTTNRPFQEITPLPGIYFFDGWRTNIGHPIQPAKHQGGASIRWWNNHAYPSGTEPTRSPEEEARDILATAAKNQPEDGPSTRRAAIRDVNSLEQWLANMASNYRQYTMPQKYIHNAAEEAQQMK